LDRGEVVGNLTDRNEVKGRSGGLRRHLGQTRPHLKIATLVGIDETEGGALAGSSLRLGVVRVLGYGVTSLMPLVELETPVVAKL
jgi:hypothetical protein